MNSKLPILFIDSGDTLVDESTEIRDSRGIVQKAELIPGAREMLLSLYDQGFCVALVADGDRESFENVYTQHDLKFVFETMVYSEDVGVCKPDAAMFRTALERLQLTEEVMPRIVMVGNNLERDIAGANALGVTSVLQTWSPRYRHTPETRLEQPDFTITSPAELPSLLQTLANRNL